jgi:hypothetical protein
MSRATQEKERSGKMARAELLGDGVRTRNIETDPFLSDPMGFALGRAQYGCNKV